MWACARCLVLKEIDAAAGASWKPKSYIKDFVAEPCWFITRKAEPAVQFNMVFWAEEYKGLNDLQVMCLIKLHCSMQICLLPKSKMWVEADDHHSISRLSQEPIPQVFVPKIEVKNTHTHIHTKTVSCKDMDSTDDAAFCICEVLKAQASKYMAIWQLEKKRKNYEVDLMSLKNLGLNLLAVGGVFDLLQASEFWSHTTKSPNGWIKFPYSPSSSLN